MPTENSVATTRSLLEIALGFVGALLIVPVLFTAVRLALRTTFGLFRIRTVQKLVGEAVFVGLTTLLTRDDVLDKVFGDKTANASGDGAPARRKRASQS